jgi:hypothetical protein
MSCLTGYIGIKNCPGAESPESGLFVNSLPGISLESIDKSANELQISYAGVWADAQDEAWPDFRLGFISELTKCFQITTKCDYDALICANKAVLANAWRYLLGNKLMLIRKYSDRLNRFTMIKKEESDELINLYQVEYESALKQAVLLIDISSCSCMECGGNPQTVTWLP